jgi:hypothetical protein
MLKKIATHIFFLDKGIFIPTSAEVLHATNPYC